MKEIPENAIKSTLLTWMATARIGQEMYAWYLNYMKEVLASMTEDGQKTLGVHATVTDCLNWNLGETLNLGETPDVNTQKSWRGHFDAIETKKVGPKLMICQLASQMDLCRIKKPTLRNIPPVRIPTPSSATKPTIDNER